MLSICGWRTCLTDKSLYDAVEGAAIIFAGGAECEEVLGCLGGGFAEYFEFEVTESGVQLCRSLAENPILGKGLLAYCDRHGGE
jgi:hypothetical protein